MKKSVNIFSKEDGSLKRDRVERIVIDKYKEDGSPTSTIKILEK